MSGPRVLYGGWLSVSSAQKHMRGVCHANSRLPPSTAGYVIGDEQMPFDDQNLFFADPAHQRGMRQKCDAAPRRIVSLRLGALRIETLHLNRRQIEQSLANAL